MTTVSAPRIQTTRITLMGTGKLRFNDSKHMTIIKVTSEKHDLTEMVGKDRTVTPVTGNVQRSAEMYIAGATVFRFTYNARTGNFAWEVGQNCEVTIEFQSDRASFLADPARTPGQIDPVSEMIGNQ